MHADDLHRKNIHAYIYMYARESRQIAKSCIYHAAIKLKIKSRTVKEFNTSRYQVEAYQMIARSER